MSNPVAIPLRAAELRDYIAGQALVGMLPMHSRPGVLPLSIDQMADRAYEYADALLRARGKRPA